MPFDTLNPTDFITRGSGGTGFVVSNGNLTITDGFTSDNASGNQIRSFSANALGKYYIEVTCTNVGQMSYSGPGLYDSTGALSSSIERAVFCVNGYTGSTTMPSTTTGGVMCVAFDTVNKLIWYRTGAANWNNSGSANPSTGTGGISINSSLTGAYKIGVGMVQNGASPAGVFTFNFGASAFAEAVPSGFNAGWPLTVPAFFAAS
jgi:hypothetical protein